VTFMRHCNNLNNLEVQLNVAVCIRHNYIQCLMLLFFYFKGIWIATQIPNFRIWKTCPDLKS